MRALMMDIDGVLVRGRPDDGRPWSTRLEADLGLRPDDLQRRFFVPHWDDIVLGRAGLLDHLPLVLKEIAPHLTPQQLTAYWFEQDSRLDDTLLRDLAGFRAAGMAVHLATNQEHMRAQHLMEKVGLADHIDGFHYSAALGCRKPSPDFFRCVTARVGLAPRNLVLVDDTIENVRAARATGWHAIHWTGEHPLAALLKPHLAGRPAARRS
ncbi:HAD-IA family hydrolase [Vineibacter terrae]|uniref:HAD-IA family hydrolase n=1 Tax=Vineibacter terrae TaxID=2586908 RepID=UPI002E33742C|nr:HAD-IA family hydrolase [Vineibacter terrae]HEX2885427.1 HAD-IA family hydrolase [Vineibacter terrae]